MHLLGCHQLYFTHLPALAGIDPRPAVFPPPLSSLPQFNVPNLRFLKQRALARLKLERIDQCASSQGGYIAEAKRVLAAAVHTASAQEAATVESRCGAGGQGAGQGGLQVAWLEEACLACLAELPGLIARLWHRSNRPHHCHPCLALHLPSPHLLTCPPSPPLCPPAPPCSCSGAIGPLLRYLRDHKHNDAALRSGLHTLSLLVSNSPNRGIIVSFHVGC
jgi:hypothetical protein